LSLRKLYSLGWQPLASANLAGRFLDVAVGSQEAKAKAVACPHTVFFQKRKVRRRSHRAVS
jgi:hypothetical protein